MSNMAGIIPISGKSGVDYNFPWHDCLMPLSKDYYAIQHAVYECAMVGCKTIWIVSGLEFQPLVKEIVQEWVMDPFTIDKDKAKESYEHVRVPIYYVPIHGKDKDRRDCLAWTVLYGCTMASEVSTKMSSWMNYEKFYVSFPHGIFDVERELRGYRRQLKNEISSSDGEFCLTSDGKDVTSGLHTSFTISSAGVSDTLKRFKELEWEASRKGIKNPAVDFSLDIVFKHLYDDCELKRHALPVYHQTNTWAGYRGYLSSREIEKPRVIKRFEGRKRQWKRMFHED